MRLVQFIYKLILCTLKIKCALLDGIKVPEEISEEISRDEFDFFEAQIDVMSEKNIQTDLSFRWPGGKLYVDIDPSVAPNVVGVLHQAIRELEAKTSLTFKARDTEDDWIQSFKK